MSALQLVFLGGQRYDIAKARKRGKERSVDYCLRSSICRRAESSLKQVFADWRKTAAKAAVIAYARLKKDEVDDLIEHIITEIALNDFSVDVVDAITPEMRAAFREAGVTALAEVKFDTGPGIVNTLDKNASAYAATHGADLVTRISESTRDDLRELISNAIDNGWSSQTLADGVEEMFAFSEARSLMIARTELAFSHVQGNIAGYRESGMVEKKRWLVAQDNVCPRCEALDGKTVGIDDEFHDDEEDEDVDGPPLHPNCRCDILPVLEEASPPEEAATPEEEE